MAIAIHFKIYRIIENIFFEDKIVNQEFVEEMKNNKVKVIVRTNGIIDRYGVDYDNVNTIRDYMHATYKIIEKSCVNSHCINILEFSNKSLIAGYIKDEKGNISKIYHIFKNNRIEKTKLNDLKLISESFNPLSSHYNDRVFDKIFCKEIFGVRRVMTFKRFIRGLILFLVGLISLIGTISFVALPIMFFFCKTLFRNMTSINNMINVSVVLTMFCSLVFWIYIVISSIQSKKEVFDLDFLNIDENKEYEGNHINTSRA